MSTNESVFDAIIEQIPSLKHALNKRNSSEESIEMIDFKSEIKIAHETGDKIDFEISMESDGSLDDVESLSSSVEDLQVSCTENATRNVKPVDNMSNVLDEHMNIGNGIYYLQIR